MLSQRSGPEFTIFGRIFTVRTPWVVATAIALALTALQLAPNRSINGPSLIWYLNGVVLAAAAAGAILVHELAHALVGQKLGRAPERISIYPLGGAVEDFNDPGTPRQETLIAIAGPIVSALIGGLLFLAWALLPTRDLMLGDDLLVLGAMNAILAGVNLLPGYPLDGGRVFRALVWYLHDDFATGTRASVAYGQIISTFALATGLVFLGSRGSWSLLGVWIIFGAWGVARVGRQEMTRSVFLSLGSSLTAGEAVRGLNPHVRADQPLDEVLEALLAEMHSGPGLVTCDGNVIGVISLNELRRYRRMQWPETKAQDAMVPIGRLSTLDQSVSVRRLLNELTDQRSDTLLVTGEEGVVGAINRQIAVAKLIDRVQAARFDH
jgi:Zn-dependent protease